MELTEQEQRFLASRPEVAKLLATFNRRQAAMPAVRTPHADEVALLHINRARQFDAIARG